MVGQFVGLTNDVQHREEIKIGRLFWERRRGVCLNVREDRRTLEAQGAYPETCDQGFERQV